MTKIAKSFINSNGESGQFNSEVAPNRWSWNIDLPPGLGTTQRDSVMESLGFEYIPSVNIAEHWPSGVVSHWQGNVNGNWYHIIFGGGWMNDLYVDEWHYEVHRPLSQDHLDDWWNKNKVTGRAKCPRKRRKTCR